MDKQSGNGVETKSFEDRLYWWLYKISPSLPGQYKDSIREIARKGPVTAASMIQALTELTA